MKTTAIILTIAITSCVTVCGMVGCFVGGMFTAITIDDSISNHEYTSKVNYDR